jgi:hypothetical protein
MAVITWEHELEPVTDNSSTTDFEDKFAIRGIEGWQYAGMLRHPNGAEFLVWKRPKE